MHKSCSCAQQHILVSSTWLMPYVRTPHAHSDPRQTDQRCGPVCSVIQQALQTRPLLQLHYKVLLLLGPVLKDTDSLLWSRCASSKCKQRL